jgi:predicted phage-related endonuclease
MRVLVQGQWYAGIWRSHGYNVTNVVTLCEINHDAPLEYTNEFRPGLFQKLVAITLEWWNKHVVTGTPPPLDGSASCHRFIERSHQRTRGSVLAARPEDEDLFTEFFAAQDAVAAAEQRLATVKAMVKHRMGAHEVLQGATHKFIHKANKAGTFSLTVQPPRGQA